MKTKRTLLTWILIVICAITGSTSTFAASIHSISDGTWSDAAVWSSGTVPNSTDDITIQHTISKSGPLVLSASGRLTIQSGGKFIVNGPFQNDGIIINHDSLVLEGLANYGVLENYAVTVLSKNLENLPVGAISNYGTVTMHGNLSNNWKIENSGTFYVTGNFDNYFALSAPAGVSGYFEVCGNVTHHNTGSITGTMFLCLRCGGHYNAESGHTGEFTLNCAPFAALVYDFKAEISSEGFVNLTWTTQTESNCEWFIIERATTFDGIACNIGKCGSPQDFKEIGRTHAAGNSDKPLYYQFADVKPVAGIDYYRLHILDHDGNGGYSSIAAVPMENQQTTLLAYPNPNNSILHIQATGNPTEKAVLSLFSVDGKRVWERTIELGQSTYRYDMQICDFADGVYLLRLTQGNQQEVRKLVFLK